MVRKSTLALIGLGVLGVLFIANRAKTVTKTIVRDEPIPIPVPEPVIIPEFVETPLTLKTAVDRVKQQYGDIYTKVTERVRKDYQEKIGNERWKWFVNYENVTKEVKL
jgi:hypothetical protein